MNFELNEEQKIIQQTALEFVRKEVKPQIGEYEENETFPWPLVKGAAKLGFMGMAIPEKYGGVELDTVSYCLVIEEISKISGGLALIISANNSHSGAPIAAHANEEQKQKYLPPLAAGKKLGCWAITEPNAGSDVAGQKATARLDNGQWILNGTKNFITNGSVADICVATFRTDPNPHNGLSAFIIEKSAPGFGVGRIEKKMGLNCTLTAELIFENCRIPQENLLGQKGEGFKIAMHTLNAGRISIAAQGLGIAEGAFEEALKYAKERTQFNKPIAGFQAIQFMLADMATEIELARLLIYEAAWLKDSGLQFIKHASMAKVFASEMAERTTSRAVQIFGGYGYMKDFPVERFYRDARILQVYEGTSQVQRIIIAKHLLKEK